MLARNPKKANGERPMFRKILHANDGSEHAFDALSLALKIAKGSGAELHMVSIEEIDTCRNLLKRFERR